MIFDNHLTILDFWRIYWRVLIGKPPRITWCQPLYVIRYMREIGYRGEGQHGRN